MTDAKITNAKHTLAHFLELADRGPALRAALAEELTQLLTDWPAHYPDEMRTACEALLEKAKCEISEIPPEPEAAPELQPEPDGRLIAAARAGKDFEKIFAARLGISRSRADGILADRTGRDLTIACKGARLGRPAYSAIAILAGDADRKTRLAAYETVPAPDAERTLDAWRKLDRFANAAA